MFDLLLTLAVIQAKPLARDSIQERLEGRASFSFSTVRTPIEMEPCVADVLSRIGVPSSFIDGTDRTILVVDRVGRVITTVELNDSPTGTKMIGRIYGNVWNEQMRERIQICLIDPAAPPGPSA